jgi:hypothetical protein
MSTVSPTVIRKNQTYALCAKAKCFVFNSLAYCECDILLGNRVSGTFSYPVLPPDSAKQNIYDLNAEGAGNGYMASTFRLPSAALKGGTMRGANGRHSLLIGQAYGQNPGVNECFP